MTVKNGTETESLDLIGIKLGGGIGNDYWISENWSVGPSLDITHAALSKGNVGRDHLEHTARATAIVVACAFTYH